MAEEPGQVFKHQILREIHSQSFQTLDKVVPNINHQDDDDMASVAEGNSSLAGAGESTAAGGTADGLRGNREISSSPSRRWRPPVRCRCTCCRDFERDACFLGNSQLILERIFQRRLKEKNPSRAGIEGADSMLSWKEIQEVLDEHSRDVHRRMTRRRRNDQVLADGQPGLFPPCCSSKTD